VLLICRTAGKDRELKAPVEFKQRSTWRRSSRARTIPLHFFKEESIQTFQKTIKELFPGAETREMTNRYLQLFIEKIVVNLPRVDIAGKTDVVLAALENEKAISTGGILTASGNWLPPKPAKMSTGRSRFLYLEKTALRARAKKSPPSPSLPSKQHGEPGQSRLRPKGAPERVALTAQ
jgi:hypothetical protein